MRVGATLAFGSPLPQAAVPACSGGSLGARFSGSYRPGGTCPAEVGKSVLLFRVVVLGAFQAGLLLAVQRAAVFEAISMLVFQVIGHCVGHKSKNEFDQHLCSCFIVRVRVRSSNALLPDSY